MYITNMTQSLFWAFGDIEFGDRPLRYYHIINVVVVVVVFDAVGVVGGVVVVGIVVYGCIVDAVVVARDLLELLESASTRGGLTGAAVPGRRALCFCVVAVVDDAVVVRFVYVFVVGDALDAVEMVEFHFHFVGGEFRD